MCDKPHTYTVEVVGAPARYVGTDQDEAISAYLTVDPDYDEEGYVVAEHILDAGTELCPAESDRIENEAIAARADMDAKWAMAYEAFHGDGPYAAVPF